MHKERDVTSTAASWPASTSGRGSMHPRGALLTRLRATTMALLTAALVLCTAAPPAHALDPGTVVAAATTAYDTYQKFSGGQMTLEQATALIVSAINQAKVEIITHIDILAAGEVQACARNAVIGVLDLRNMSPDTAQQFALDATGCAALAQARIGSFEDLFSVALAGLALNVVGPIALLARAHTHLQLGTPELVSTLRDANTSLKTRLHPSCTYQIHQEDREIQMTCIAYNGNRGSDGVSFGEPVDYTNAVAAAMRGTSYLVALAVLPRLQA